MRVRSTSLSLAFLAAVAGFAPAAPAVASEPAPGATPPAAEADPAPATTAPAPAAPEPGELKTTVYGIVFFNGFSNTSGTNNADIPLFATAGGAANVSASARQTRVGIRVKGATLGGAKLGGVVEADLFGGFPNIGIGESFGLLRLRQAFARLDWRRASLLAGQDWMVFAPATPASIACAAIPLMASTGNPWMRLPQVRFEGRAGGGDGDRGFSLLLQLAALAPASGDFTPGFLLQPGSGALSRTPYLQGRLALAETRFLGRSRPATIGASFHYGRSRVGTAPATEDVDSVGAALDWSLPLLPRVSLAGEAFLGENLLPFQAGVFQGINPDFAAGPQGPGVPRSIRTRGGWAQLGVTPGRTDKVAFYATYGLDDPDDADLSSVAARDWRSRNRAFAASVLHKPSPLLSWGVEVRRVETSTTLNGERTNTHVNLGVALSF